MIRNLTILMLILIAAVAAPVAAETQDIAAAARSVPRVVLIASDGDNAYFVGHGSGVVIAPDLVLTNAHVVELAREERNIAIGVIPAEGKQSYGARIVAFSPGNDLALLRIENGRLPPATFFSNAVGDGQAAVAVGYPGAVDRAQGLSLAELIQPMTPVKTEGAVSSGRASKSFDTVLHTAPLASGNSGGPLVDECGRVLGVNSFGSISDGSDAEFGFAVSNREIASFLRQAGVQPQRSAAPCRSIAELEAADRLAAAEERALAAERSGEAERKRMATAQEERAKAEYAVIAQRETMMFVAFALVGFGILAIGAAGLNHNQGRVKPARNFAIAGAALVASGVVAFALRPSFDTAPIRADIVPASAGPNAAVPGVGANLCRIDETRSRITISDTQDVPFTWSADGCLNGQTQFVQNAEDWSRVFVPGSEATVSVRRFNPVTGTYRDDRYLIDAETADRARKLRTAIEGKGCTSDPARLAALAQMQSDVAGLLPPMPNERLVYRCTPTRP